jgi:hypothetical protein
MVSASNGHQLAGRCQGTARRLGMAIDCTLPWPAAIIAAGWLDDDSSRVDDSGGPRLQARLSDLAGHHAGLFFLGPKSKQGRLDFQGTVQWLRVFTSAI